MRYADVSGKHLSQQFAFPGEIRPNQDMFEIRYDPVARMLHLRLSGFWTPEVASRFAEELEREINDIGDSADFTVLSDSRDFPAQSAAIAQELGMIAVTGAARRSAFIVGGALSKIQASRVMPGDHIRIFLDEAEARKWLEQRD